MANASKDKPVRVRVVTSGVVIQPIPDDLKMELDVVDNAGRPKQSRVDLRPSDNVTVVQWERYNERHDCDQCATKSKSNQVVMLRNERTGQVFYSAGDCLKNHFNVSIKEFEEGSSLLVRVLNGLLRALSLDDTFAEDSKSALTGALANFKALESFDCAATAQAIDVLQTAYERPELASRGLLDNQLHPMLAYVQLQEDFRRNPVRFEDRLRALQSHPIAWERPDWPTSLFEKALNRRAELSLEDFEDLRTALTEASGFTIALRNAAVPPWIFSSREEYHKGLQAHFQFEAEIAPDKPRYHAQKQEGLGDALLAQAKRKDPFVFIVYAPRHITSWFMDLALANQDTIEGRGAQVAWASRHRTADIGGRNRVELAEAKGCAVYYRDRWSSSYGIWHRYGSDGREQLEVLDEWPFDQPITTSPAEEGKPESASSFGDTSEPSTPGVQEQIEAPVVDVNPVSSAISEAEVETEIERVTFELMEGRGLPLTERDILQIRTNLVDVATATLAGDNNHLAEAEKRLDQELSSLSSRRAAEEETTQADSEVPDEKREVRAELPSVAVVSTGAVPARASEPVDRQNKVTLHFRGQRVMVEQRVRSARELALQPRWVFFSTTDRSRPWEAAVEVSEEQPDLISKLIDHGWSFPRGTGRP